MKGPTTRRQARHHIEVAGLADRPWAPSPAVRAERQQTATDVLTTATPQLLAEERANPWGGDEQVAVGDCSRVILRRSGGTCATTRRDLALLG